MHNFADLLLEELEYDCQVKEILPTEMINEYKENRMDYVILTNKNTIIDFEFDSSQLSNDDIRRYAIYAYILGKEYKIDVISVIISTYYEDNFTEEFKIHKTATHPLFIHSLKTIDGDEVFRKIKENHENNEKITQKEVSQLSLIPFYGSKYSIEDVLYNIITLTKDLELSKEQHTYLKISYGELLKHFVKDEETYNELKEVIKMRENCVLEQIREISDRYIDSEIEKGTQELKKANQELEKINQELEKAHQEDMETSKIVIAKEMIKNNCTKDQVINSTKITESMYLALLKV